ncbi:MAG: preprotein translocase subunit SecE [Pseudomonadota bacterium]|nr:preprotein translocase subunit SecE [Pseudomonadota bacterium]
MAGFNPAEYIRQVRSEARKITWPTRKETTSSTIAVFIMVAIASVFLFLADFIMTNAVQFILSLGA